MLLSITDNLCNKTCLLFRLRQVLTLRFDQTGTSKNTKTFVYMNWVKGIKKEVDRYPCYS